MGKATLRNWLKYTFFWLLSQATMAVGIALCPYCGHKLTISGEDFTCHNRHCRHFGISHNSGNRAGLEWH